VELAEMFVLQMRLEPVRMDSVDVLQGLKLILARGFVNVLLPKHFADYQMVFQLLVVIA
jgi:hypothetical protein